MDNLYHLIIKILERPEIYIGKPSIQRLYAFINGYLHQNELANDHCLDGFNEYIAAHYRIDSDHNWASIIEFYSNTDQNQIDLFKKHFENFTRTRGQGDCSKTGDGSEGQGTVRNH